MKIDQLKLNDGNQFDFLINNILDKSLAQIVLVFGDRLILENTNWLKKIKELYANANIISSSTSGNISDINLFDEQIIFTAIYFEKTVVKINIYNNSNNDNSKNAGINLSKYIEKENLNHILVISDGQTVNGSDLIAGFKGNIPDNVSITGGLAGDAARFEKTIVGLNDDIKEGNIITLSFYGESLKVGFGSMGGWETFGPIRTVTKSKNNVLFEFDNESALGLYKLYLGDKAKELPSSSLFFPLQIQNGENGNKLVRTVLNIDENEGSMTFAGDIPIGAKAQLMKANFESLIGGAEKAAETSQLTNNINNPQLAILISCVGRKLVLGQRIEEELEAVKNIFGEETILTGFYSYGELCPSSKNQNTDLHNQTMTITTFSEV